MISLWTGRRTFLNLLRNFTMNLIPDVFLVAIAGDNLAKVSVTVLPEDETRLAGSLDFGIWDLGSGLGDRNEGKLKKTLPTTIYSPSIKS